MRTNNMEDKKDSFILIKFEGVGSVVLQAAFENVTPLQILAASQYIEVKAKNELIMQENARMAREADQNIARPQQGILLPK